MNPGEEQELQFKLRVLGDSGFVANPTFEIDKSATVSIALEVKAGQTLLCEGDDLARMYDEKGNQIKTIKIESKPPKIGQGRHDIEFDCEFQGAPSPKVAVIFKTVGKPEAVKRKSKI